MTDEEALFEAWYPLVESRIWQDMYGGTTAPPGWKEELKIAMREGWMARASLHVTEAKPGITEVAGSAVDGETKHG